MVDKGFLDTFIKKKFTFVGFTLNKGVRTFGVIHRVPVNYSSMLKCPLLYLSVSLIHETYSSRSHSVLNVRSSDPDLKR